MTELRSARVRPGAITLCFLIAACPAAPPPAGPAVLELPPPIVGGERTPPPNETTAQWPAPSVLRVLVNHSGRGEVEACGCPGAPSGGMARRETFLRAARETWGDLVVIEGPDALVRPLGPAEEITGELRQRARDTLAMLSLTHPEAYFPSSLDVEVLGLPELARWGRDSGTTIVATNVGGQAIPGIERAFVRSVGGREVLFLGVWGPARSAVAARVAPVEDAAEAVRRVVAEHPSVDAVIAISSAPWRELTALLVPEVPVDLWMLGPPAKGEPSTAWFGSSLVARADPHGRALTRLSLAFGAVEGRGGARDAAAGAALDRLFAAEDVLAQRTWQLRALDLDPTVVEGVSEAPGSLAGLDLDRDAPFLRRGIDDAKAQRARLLAQLGDPRRQGHLFSAHRRTLAPELPEDPAVLDRLTALRGAQLAEIVAAAPEPADEGRRYLGRDACIRCHAPLDAHWARETAHAGAWRTLVERGQTGNPECLRCHTTGFGRPGGFRDPATDAHLLNVQCEACHGPMEAHVVAAGRQGFRPPPGPPVTEGMCLGCHDAANSPTFDYAAAVQRIAHPR